MNKTSTTRISAVVLALLLMLSMLSACASGSNSSAAADPVTKLGSGAKTVTLQVYHKDGTRKDYAISTDEAILSDALLAEGLIAGSDSQYGLFVETVDGETADGANQEWWCLTKDGKMHMYGVDATEIADGEIYQFTLAEGYDVVIEYPSAEEEAAAA